MNYDDQRQVDVMEAMIDAMAEFIIGLRVMVDAGDMDGVRAAIIERVEAVDEADAANKPGLC